MRGKEERVKVFDTDKRIRLGIWGLGRGMTFYKCCKSFNIDVVADGPFKAFLNGRELVCDPDATNPISSHVVTVPARWKKGVNEVVIAMRTNVGRADGFLARALLESERSRTA